MSESTGSFQERRDANLPFGYVWRWTAVTACVLCPYKCRQRVHSFDDCPKRIDVDSVLVRCCGSGKSRRFKLLYPFQREALGQGLSFVLDLEQLQWTTVSSRRDWAFNAVDPSPMLRERFNSSVDEARHAPDQTTCRDSFRQAFAKAYLNGHTMTATAMLMLIDNPQRLINSTAHGTTFLATACELADFRAVAFLLEHGADPNVYGSFQDPPLATAIRFFQTGVAWELIRHGASVFCSDTGGRTLHQLANDAVSQLSARSNYSELPARLKTLSSLELIGIVQDLVAICNLFESKTFQDTRAADTTSPTALRKHSIRRHGQNSGAAIQVYEQTFETPMKSKTTSYAALHRGWPFPVLHALSGSSKGRFNELDGTIDREIWTERVMLLASIVKHQFPFRESRAYWACHAEKQVVAAYLWYHSAVYLPSLPLLSDDYAERLRAVIESAPTQWLTPQRDIVVSQRSCKDCEAFLGNILRHTGISFRLTIAEERLA